MSNLLYRHTGSQMPISGRLIINNVLVVLAMVPSELFLLIHLMVLTVGYFSPIGIDLP